MSSFDPTTVHLGYYPREWQQRCHRERRRFTVLAVHRRAGKTELALMETIDAALRCEKELGLFVYLAPYLRQAKAVAWARLKERLEPLRLAGAVDFSEGELSVVLTHNRATIRLFGADNADALRGLRLDGAVLDDPAWFRREVWTDVVQPALSDRLGWALMIGTPNGINLFSELHAKAATLPDWRALRFTVEETNSIDAAEVERLRRDMPAQSFAREYLCDFGASADDQLLSLTDVEAAAARRYTGRDFAQAPSVLGVDPARFGDDRSVIVRRQGLHVFPPVVLRGVDNMTLAARVAEAIGEHLHTDAVFIDSGAGAGVIDRLRQLGFDVVEVPFGGRALRPDQFANRRAEMWWALREWIAAGGSIPNDSDLKQELATPVYWFDGQGRKVLEGKDDIKKRLQGGASPDIADALALTFAVPVHIDAHELERRKWGLLRTWDEPVPALEERDPLRRMAEQRRRGIGYDPYAFLSRR